MICEPSPEAGELLTAIRHKLAAAGGVDLLRNACGSPEKRREAGRLLEEFGVWELDPHVDGVELEAAAMVAMAAGEVALPYPVPERIAGHGPRSALALISRAGARTLAPHVDLDLDWAAVDMAGAAYDVVDRSTAVSGSTLGPFVGELTAMKLSDDAGRRDAALLMTLQSWWVIGNLRAALSRTVTHVREREQFGRPLSRFQAVQFRIADMDVAVRGLEELSKYSLWSVRDNDPAISLTDALGTRLAALEASGVVMRGSHQLHGAMGFTDEVDVSWLSRASQAVRRLPEGESQTNEALLDAITRAGYPGVADPRG